MDKTQYNLMKNGEPYQFDEYLDDLQKKCAKILHKLNSLPYGNKNRDKLCNKLFKSFGKNNILKEGLKCNFGFNISIGDNCLLNYNLTILDSFEVEIGNNVFIAPNVVISPVTHSLNANERKTQKGSKIIIEDNVWIGAGAIILPGVTIHEEAVIGAGAVVNKDVSAKTVVAGVPAKFIKKIQ